MIDCEHCVEITQPDGVGAIHVSSARKKAGLVAEEEILAQLKSDCPDDTDFESVRCGDFTGYLAEYTDWSSDRFWKKWFVAYRQDLLFVTYTCNRGEEELETSQTATLLSSLRSRA